MAAQHRYYILKHMQLLLRKENSIASAIFLEKINTLIKECLTSKKYTQMKRYNHLSYEQRYTIEKMLKANNKVKQIALAIGRDPKTIYREIKRNKYRGKYTASKAEELALERKHDSHLKKVFTRKMRRIVKTFLTKEQWSPQQIIGWCKDRNIDMVSHETIYEFIWADKEMGGSLYKHLRTGHKKYRKRYGKNEKRGHIPDKVSIEQRPAQANNRERFGDWEIDLIVGAGHKGAVLTMVERTTSYLIMRKTNGKKPASVKQEIIKGLKKFKGTIQSITNDNGKEFIKHKEYAEKLNTNVYFCHPYASHERGLNEYTNKLIRQYIPKSMDLRTIKPSRIREVQNKLNRRPRAKLNFKTPNEIFMFNLDKKMALAG